MNPGKMRQRATFQDRQMIDDGFGNVIGGWETRFLRWCHVRYLRGSETVMAARLASRQPVLVTIRQDSETATITPEWRVLTGTPEDNPADNPPPPPAVLAQIEDAQKRQEATEAKLADLADQVRALTEMQRKGLWARLFGGR